MAIELTKEDILWLKEKYPNLKITDNNFLAGKLNFNREFEKISVSSFYLLEINLEPKQGSIIPQVKETAGKIETISEELNLPIIDLHINRDSTICLCIYKKEKKYFPNGFSIQIFFEEILEPYLYWVTYYQNHKTPPWDGYAHGGLGYLELYAENNVSFEELKNYFSTEELAGFKKCKGHHPCFCGSNQKLRNCHKLLYNSVYKLKNKSHE